MLFTKELIVALCSKFFVQLKMNILLNKFMNSIEFIYTNLQIKELRKLINREIRNRPGIYCFVNATNGNTYVGSAKNLRIRLKGHYLGTRSNLILQKAISKYGISQFYFVVLEYCEIEDLIKREQYYIDQLDPIYNILRTAGSSLGYQHTEEYKELFSGENHPLFGKSHTELTKSQIRESMLGSTRSEEVKKKISDSLKSKDLSGTNNSFFGKTHTDESLRKMSEANSGTKHYNWNKPAHNVKSVSLYDLENNLIKNFKSKSELADYLGVTRRTVNNYLKSGKVFKDKWVFK